VQRIVANNILDCKFLLNRWGVSSANDGAYLIIGFACAGGDLQLPNESSAQNYKHSEKRRYFNGNEQGVDSEYQAFPDLAGLLDSTPDLAGPLYSTQLEDIEERGRGQGRGCSRQGSISTRLRASTSQLSIIAETSTCRD
jgi:hypothetical protein